MMHFLNPKSKLPFVRLKTSRIMLKTLDPPLGWFSKFWNVLKIKLQKSCIFWIQHANFSSLDWKPPKVKVENSGPSVGFALRRRTGLQTPEQRVRPGATIFRQIGFLPFPKKYSIFNPRNFPQPISIINSCSNSFLYLLCIFHSPFSLTVNWRTSLQRMDIDSLICR